MDARRLAGVWSGSSWLMIGAGGGLLWTRWWTFWFWRRGVSWLVSQFCRRQYNSAIIFLST
jgi:hypothetical protein